MSEIKNRLALWFLFGTYSYSRYLDKTRHDLIILFWRRTWYTSNTNSYFR
jgi:hypothetical protein